MIQWKFACQLVRPQMLRLSASVSSWTMLNWSHEVLLQRLTGAFWKILVFLWSCQKKPITSLLTKHNISRQCSFITRIKRSLSVSWKMLFSFRSLIFLRARSIHVGHEEKVLLRHFKSSCDRLSKQVGSELTKRSRQNCSRFLAHFLPKSKGAISKPSCRKEIFLLNFDTIC